MPRDTVSYLRISQDRAGDDLAIDRQRGDITELAGVRGTTIAREYADRVSAAGQKTRPEFEQLLTDIEHDRVGMIVAWAFDRLTRAPRDTVRLLDACRVHRVRIVLVRGDDIDVTTPAGEFVASMLANLARMEVQQKADRQRRQQRQAAEQGRTPASRRAFGYSARERDSDGTPVSRLEPTEAPLVVECYRQVLAGRSMGAIAGWLNGQGSTTPRGRPWSYHNLKAVLTNPRYMGVRGVKMLQPGRAGEAGRREEYHTEIAPGTWPAIVTEETWRAAQTILRDPARRKNHPVNTAQYLLPFIARCGTCGGHLITGSRVTISRTTGERTHDRLLRCWSLKHVSRLAKPIEEAVESYLLGALTNPDARAVISRAAAGPEVDVDDLRQRVAVLRARRDEATALWADGVLDSASLRFAHQRVDEQLAELDAQLATAFQADPVLEVAGADDPAAVWSTWPMDTKRAVVAALVDVVVHPGKPGRPGGKRFDPTSIELKWRR